MQWILLPAALAAAVALGARWAYGQAFYYPVDQKALSVDGATGAQYDAIWEKTRHLMEELEARPFEPVEITAKDGTSLFGRYYHVADGAPVQIQFHGYKGKATRDFCGGNALARQMGQNTLVVDQRSHGRSGGSTIGFGVLERWDCVCWVEYVLERFGADTSIYLAGVSMGAATVLMAAGLPLPANVKGIIADSSYSSPEAILRKVSRDRGYPAGAAFLLLRLGARLFGGFDPCAASPLEAVRRTSIPILLIHGEADHFVPCDMSWAIRAACTGPVTLVTVPGAGHGMGYVVDTPRYEAEVRAFAARCERNER